VGFALRRGFPLGGTTRPTSTAPEGRTREQPPVQSLQTRTHGSRTGPCVKHVLTHPSLSRSRTKGAINALVRLTPANVSSITLLDRILTGELAIILLATLFVYLRIQSAGDIAGGHTQAP